MTETRVTEILSGVIQWPKKEILVGNAARRRERHQEREAKRAARHLHDATTRRARRHSAVRRSAFVSLSFLIVVTLALGVTAWILPRAQAFERDNSRVVEIFAEPKNPEFYTAAHVAGSNIALKLREERSFLQNLGLLREPILQIKVNFALPWDGGAPGPELNDIDELRGRSQRTKGSRRSVASGSPATGST
ncbi:hypothetical protein ABIE21_001079 [Conyzicola nivalis]|uniref:Uncharacterized protein n=1 Tax=Conyzicola nivalis TaxID=1477021 RepID=A0ABV2QKL1_9MICO